MAQKNEDAFSLQVDAQKHYTISRYITPSRMASFCYQLRFVEQYFNDCSLLEIGVGSGIVANILRSYSYNIQTLDIDQELNPDIHASIYAIPKEQNTYGAFICSQVLEHLEWERVDIALSELHRVVTKGGIISVPTNKPCWAFLKFDSKSWGARSISVSLRRKRKMRLNDGQHFWELEANRKAKEFETKLLNAGFDIIKSYQPIECPYHQYYVVVKQA